MSKSYIGINYDGCHDSTVAYLTDKIEYIGQEERFSRSKKDGRPPFRALEYLRKNYIINDENVRYAFPILDEKHSDAEWQRSGLLDVYKDIKIHKRYGMDFARSINDQPVFVRHHDAHAASAYFTSGFIDKTLVFTADGGNFFDPYSTNLYEGYAGRLEPIKRVPSTLWAQRYSIVTSVMGFTPVHHEGKITGLSSCGTHNMELITKLRDILEDPSLGGRINEWKNLGSVDEVPSIKVVPSATTIFDDILKKYSREDIAYAIQHITEKDVFDFLKPYVGQYQNIALAGGIFANIKINSMIKDMGFKNIFVHPAMGDDGLALGAALFAKMTDENSLPPFRLRNAFFGAAYNEKEIIHAIQASGLTFTHHNNIEQVIAEKLAAGDIGARFAGRGEYGPRALGHRSILCRADDPTINDSLNTKLKRTEFMPFAPVVCDYQASDLFNDLRGAEYAASFMTITRQCTALMKSIAPAAVHVDGTARPQIVTPDFDNSYYRILDTFNKLTNGQSVLINTSFNIHGEPIVDSPDQAIRSFKAAKLDFLAIENFVIS